MSMALGHLGWVMTSSRARISPCGFITFSSCNLSIPISVRHVIGMVKHPMLILRIERSFSCTRKERSTSGWSTIKILLITNLLPVSEECRNTQFFGKGNVGLLLSLIVILADLTMMTKYTCFGMAKRWFTCLVYCLVSCYL